jgi:hypothetical protein
MPSFLKFFVYENNVEFPVPDMSEPECAAIEECVKNLIPPAYNYTSGFVFDVETLTIDDIVEEEGCGLLKCNSMLNGEKRAVPIPYELLKFLAGKKFRVKPNQYGINPWGRKVEILFEALPPRVIIPLTRPAVSVPSVATAVPSVATAPETQLVTITIPGTTATVSISVSVSVSA